MSLPLRLAAEPFVRETFGQSCFVLPSLEEDKICFIVCDEGLLGMAVDQLYQKKEEISQITAMSIEDVPVCLLVRSDTSQQQSQQNFQWVIPGIVTTRGVAARREDILQHVTSLSTDCAMNIIQSIER